MRMSDFIELMRGAVEFIIACVQLVIPVIPWLLQAILTVLIAAQLLTTVRKQLHPKPIR